MVSRAYGKALTEDEIEDVYAAAWAATLSALRGRAEKMSDEELRAYLLTAVASHARKELRRRSRKPSVGFEASHEQAVSDLHLPLPDEAAISAESAGVARDLLVSLPPRRRAVMLLRYGWGLAPGEVCALISGLSPRAYRKEVTRGVEQLIERLGQHESGDWCRSREPLLRDYVAGVANEDERLQVEQHLGHCRACSEFASSLTGHLHDFGSGLAVMSAAALIGGHGFGLAERLASLLDAGRSTLSGAVERVEATLSTVAASGGARGGGAAGAGLAAKAFAGGGGAKAALACLGTGAAATACVAAGIVPGVPGVDLGGADDRLKRPEREQVRRAHPQPPTRVTDPILEVAQVPPVEDPAPTQPSPEPEEQPEPEPEGVEEPAPAVPPEVEEFDPVATAAPAPVSEPAPAPSTGGAGSGGSSVAGDEFGP